MVFKVNSYTVQCIVQICYNNISGSPYQASCCSAIEIYFRWWYGDAFGFLKKLPLHVMRENLSASKSKERAKPFQPFLWGILSQSTLQKWLYDEKFSLRLWWCQMKIIFKLFAYLLINAFIYYLLSVTSLVIDKKRSSTPGKVKKPWVLSLMILLVTFVKGN